MNLFDVLILGIINFCLIRGIYRGLIKEGLSLIGVIVGFCAGSHYYAEISELLSYYISRDIHPRIIGFLSVFLSIVIITHILIPTINYILALNFTRIIDRSLGGGVGISKGFLVSCIMLIIFSAFLPKDTPIIADSRISCHLTRISEKIILVSPKKMKHEFTEKIEAYKKKWKNHK